MVITICSLDFIGEEIVENSFQVVRANCWPNKKMATFDAYQEHLSYMEVLEISVSVI